MTMSEEQRELARSLATRADFYVDILGPWEPREDRPHARVDPEWLSKLLQAFTEAQRWRLEIRSLALGAGFAVLDEWPEPPGEEIERYQQVIRYYVEHVDDGAAFGDLVDLVPGLESDDGQYGG